MIQAPKLIPHSMIGGYESGIMYLSMAPRTGMPSVRINEFVECIHADCVDGGIPVLNNHYEALRVITTNVDHNVSRQLEVPSSS